MVTNGAFSDSISIRSDAAERCRMLPVGAASTEQAHELSGRIHRYGKCADIRSYCIDEGVLNDYPEIEYSQQPTASTSEHATQ